MRRSPGVLRGDDGESDQLYGNGILRAARGAQGDLVGGDAHREHEGVYIRVS